MIISCQLPSEYFLHTSLLAIILIHMLSISYFNFTEFYTGMDNEQLEPLLAYFEEVQAVDRNLKAQVDSFTRYHFKRQQRNDWLLYGVFVMVKGLLDIYHEDDTKENVTFFPEIVREVKKCSKRNTFAELDIRRAQETVARITEYQQEYLREVFDTKQSDMDAVFEYFRLDTHNAGVTKAQIVSVLSTVITEQRNVWWRILEAPKFSVSAVGHTDSWRKMRSIQLATELHVHLDAILNMRGCKISPQVICQFSPNKFSSDVHKVAYCLAVSYITRRTLRVKPLRWLHGCAVRKSGNYVTWQSLLSHDPQWNRAGYASVLEISKSRFDILVNADEPHPSHLPDYFMNVIQPSFIERIREFHREPEVWLVGQLAAYISKPLKAKVDIHNASEEMAFMHPVIGLYLHRTDNHTQSLASLMKHVASVIQGESSKIRVYVFTNNPDLFKMVQEIFPEYSFIQRRRSSTSDITIQDLYLDVYFLSRCDYLVCSFKWHMCRLAYELMQTNRGDSSAKALELRQRWFFDGFKGPN